MAARRSWLFLFPVPVQTVNEGAYRIRDFRLRFYASESMWQPPQEVETVSPMCCRRTAAVVEWEERSGIPSSCAQLSAQAADEYLKGVLTEAAKDVHSQAVSDVMAMLRQGERRRTQCGTVLPSTCLHMLLFSLKCTAPLNAAFHQHDFWPVRAGEVKASTPWFETYKTEFLRTLLFNDHETFDHPLACGCLPAVVIDRMNCLQHLLHCRTVTTHKMHKHESCNMQASSC